MRYLPIAAVAAVALLATGCGKSSYRSPAQERPYRGVASSTVTVVEFSDFQCPACQAAQATVSDVLAQYGGSIRFEYRHFPLTSIHRYAFRAAVASECAADQGKFWEYHDRLFREQPNFAEKDLVAYAQELGLDVEPFRACLKSDDPAQRVKDDVAEAARRKLQGTPTFFINGQQVGDWSQLGPLVRAAGAQPAAQQ